MGRFNPMTYYVTNSFHIEFGVKSQKNEANFKGEEGSKRNKVRSFNLANYLFVPGFELLVSSIYDLILGYRNSRIWAFGETVAFNKEYVKLTT